MYVNQVAFCTITALSVGTAASVIAAATTASTVATVAYATLAIGLGATSIAAITAFVDAKSTDVEKYFTNMKSHMGYVMAGMSQFVAQTLLHSLIEGAASGISKLISRKIGGEDHTVKVVTH